MAQQRTPRPASPFAETTPPCWPKPDLADGTFRGLGLGLDAVNTSSFSGLDGGYAAPPSDKPDEAPMPEPRTKKPPMPEEADDEQ